MLTKFFLSAALILSVLACSVTHAERTVAAQATKSSQTLNFKLPTGKHYNVKVKIDDTVSKNETPDKIKIVGIIKNAAVILIDTYASVPGGMSYCQAGTESFLRVISIKGAIPTETFHTKLSSCLDNIELDSPGVNWNPKASTLNIHWLQGPNPSGKGETRTLHINNQGKVKN